MVFWLLIIGLAAAVSALLALALLQRHRAQQARAEYDIAVYREQLAAVDRDVARGILDAEAAERTRTEIARRILDADRSRGTDAQGDAPRRVNLAMAGGVALVLLGGSVGLYTMQGAPGYGDLPLQERLAASAERRAERPRQAEAEEQAAAFRPEAPQPAPEYVELVDRLRATVASRPDDPRGLALLARNEAALGNFTAAYDAQRRLIDVLGARATADHYADLADMMVLAAGGYVSPEAEAVLGQALSRDPQNGPARYYVGLMQSQNGRPDIAFDIWREMLERAAPGAPWVPAIRAQIEEVAARAGRRYQLPPEGEPLAGPSAADVAAAQDMSPEDRMDMIRGMVANLSDRLANQGGTAGEWARLIGALGVLGDTDSASAIYAEARDVFADDPEGLAQISEAARGVGLGE
ncbi:c-type cytochrome biogenesis protein CcmI [Meridianimarinicoccus sp. RP-17]|uniref:c-type cytochrome biogenesis protein CcmI n=1 Tax=Meridianimarinicoccus zhengii TaxID=2056810 RepID=UPI000DAE9B62|nr:c-type cytochrome biogenesis protein CcmI [Phycocomes zhengii]